VMATTLQAFLICSLGLGLSVGVGVGVGGCPIIELDYDAACRYIRVSIAECVRTLGCTHAMVPV